jgi:hypothetical protein
MLTFARVRAITVVAALFVTAVVSVSMALSRDTDQVEVQETCPEGFVLANLSLPAAGDVKIGVYNGTNRTGLADQVADNFTNREFEVVDRGDNDSEFEGIAELHYGPQAVGAAQLVRAYFLNEATTVFDIDREDDVVEVVLGTEFRQLATPTEVHQAIAHAGNPPPPPGTCPAPESD